MGRADLAVLRRALFISPNGLLPRSGKLFEAARCDPLTNAVIALPGVDGLNAVEHLRALCPQTRVIWCSDLNFSLHAFRLRADYFLLEPVTEAALRQGFCIWLDQKIRQSSADLTATNTTRRTTYEKRKIIHSALSLSLTAALCLSMAACGGTQTPADSVAASQPSAPSAVVQPSAAETTSAALPVKALNPKQVEENPYMAKSDANIHHDGYNTDSTDEILPLAIYPEINVSYETTNANASPAIYFDSYGHAVVPLLGGIAIRDLNAEETKRSAISRQRSMTAAVTLSRAPIPSWTRPTASSAPRATTMC